MITIKNFIAILIKKPKIVLLIFGLLLIISLILIPFVGINRNRVDYLPDESNAKQGLFILNEEFPYSSKATAKVLLKETNVEDILKSKADIKQIEGVFTVIWLDDIVDLTQTPIEFIPEDVKGNYYREDKALFSIIFNDSSNSTQTLNAINEINTLLKGSGGVGLQARTVIDIGTTATIIAIIIIITIIFLFTDSIITALIIIVNIGIAIGFNFATNIIFGDISDISLLATAVIQLAVSIDYSLIFLKRFNLEKSNYVQLDIALINASTSSLKTILASSLTTIVGFLALGFMKYQIGAELGLILAKGVIFSLLTVIFLLPVLIKVFIKVIDKTKHRNFLPRFYKLSRFINGKSGYFILGLLLILVFLGYFGQKNNEYIYSDNQIEYTNLEKEIINSFGEFNDFVVIIPRGNKQNELTLLNDLMKLDNLQTISSLYQVIPPNTPNELIPQELKTQFLSENYSLISLSFDVEKESSETFNLIKKIRNLVSNYYEEFYLTGESVVIYDTKQVIDEDFLLVIIISSIAIGLIILITFKSISIPIILLLVIQTAIWINMSIPYLQNEKISFLGYILISSIQLGATIDYAIIMMENYNHNRKSFDPIEASRQAFVVSTESIIISMLALIVAGYSISLMMDMDLIKQLGVLIGRGTIFSGILSLFVLPQVLVLLDKIIAKTTLKR